jgi:hypothetical protein
MENSQMARIPHRSRGLLLAMALVTACGAAPAASPPTATPTPALASRPSSPAHIWFISPTADETVTGPVLHIDVGISGAQLTTSTSTNISPTLGHIHLYTNKALTYMNYKPTLDLPVSPGLTYAIYAEFVATDHFPFNPRIVTPTIFVHVAG